MTPTHRYAWKNTPDRAARYGQPCAVRLRSRRMRTVCVEFADGFRMATSERALRELPDLHTPRRGVQTVHRETASDQVEVAPAHPGFETFLSAQARNLAAGGRWFADEPPGVWPVLQKVPFRELDDEVLPGGYILACDARMPNQPRKRPPWNVYRIDARGKLARVTSGEAGRGWWKSPEAVAFIVARAQEAARAGGAGPCAT